MSFIAHSIKLCREETKDDSNFLNFLIPVARKPNAIDVLGEIFTPTPYRFYIESNNTIH